MRRLHSTTARANTLLARPSIVTTRCIHPRVRCIDPRVRKLSVLGSQQFFSHTAEMRRARASTLVRLFSVETRCAHCHITFAKPDELAHHARHHCFPDDPSAVTRRYPAGTSVLLPFKRTSGIVMGPSSNPSTAHACVSVKLANGFIGDMQISRLASPVRLLADENDCSGKSLRPQL